MAIHEAASSWKVPSSKFSRHPTRPICIYQQGNRSVATYSRVFNQLEDYCGLSITEERVMKYINGLKFNIQRYVGRYIMFFIEETFNLVLDTESLLRGAHSFRFTQQSTLASERSSNDKTAQFQHCVGRPTL